MNPRILIILVVVAVLLMSSAASAKEQTVNKHDGQLPPENKDGESGSHTSPVTGIISAGATILTPIVIAVLAKVTTGVGIAGGGTVAVAGGATAGEVIGAGATGATVAPSGGTAISATAVVAVEGIVLSASATAGLVVFAVIVVIVVTMIIATYVIAGNEQMWQFYKDGYDPIALMQTVQFSFFGSEFYAGGMWNSDQPEGKKTMMDALQAAMGDDLDFTVTRHQEAEYRRVIQVGPGKSLSVGFVPRTVTPTQKA